MKSPFLQAIESRPLLADGAMGTMLLERGVGPDACIEAANLDAPGLVRRIHEEYIAAGAEVIQTNTFGATRPRLARYGLGERVRDINFAGVRLARDAREIQGQPVFIAGSVGPLGPWPSPAAESTLVGARAAYAEQIGALLEGGIDLIVFETFQSLADLGEAIAAARAATDLPLVAEMTFQDDGRTLSGDSPAAVVTELARLGVEVAGANCGVGPQGALAVLEAMARASSLILSAQPNAGIPRMVGGRAHYPASPQYFAESTRRMAAAGARLIGGCCGTTPEHTKAMRAALDSFEAPAGPAATAITAPIPPPRSDAPDRPDTELPDFLPRSATGATGPSAAPVALDAEDDGEPRTLRQKLAAKRFVVSVEIDPPRGINPRKAIEGSQMLHEIGADAINIGDSPMARVRMSAVALAVLIQQRVGIETIIHCTTRDRNLMALQSDLIGAHALGVRNVIALTGDPPSGGEYAQASAVWDVDSVGFISVLKRLNEGFDWAGNSIGRGTDFFIACAANPVADDLELEIDRVRRKVDAGAHLIMTQPVWDPGLVRSFFRRLGPIDIPVLLGVLPLQNHRHAEFLHNELAGVSIPEEMRERMRRAGEAGIQEGLDIARDFLLEMRSECDGIYIMPSFGRYEVAAELVVAARSEVPAAPDR